MTVKVLVVEDDLAQSHILQEGLRHFGFEIHLAKNGEEGLRLAEELRPDVMTTDVVMPVMDGIEMITKLRETEWGKNIPVIILTNYDSQAEDINKIMTDSPTYYLVKIDSTLENIVDKLNKVAQTQLDKKLQAV